MANAIVTGASRGLGLALTRSLHERGWRLAVDARGGVELERATAGLERVAALAGDVADPWHRAALVEAAGDHDRPAGQQRQRARPEPDAGARRLSARRAAPGLRGQRARAAGARPGDRCRGSRRRAAILDVSSDAARRALRGLGRVRLLARPPSTSSPRSSGPSGPTCASTRSIRATCAPRMHQDAVSRRGHLRSPATRAQRPGAARADRRRAAERAVSRRGLDPGSRRGDGVSDDSAAGDRPGADPARGRRSRPLRRRAAGRAAGERRDRRRALRGPERVPRARRPAGRQHLGDAARPRCRPARAPGRCGSTCRAG